MSVTVTLVHRAILEDAAEIANQEVLNDPELSSKKPREQGYRPGRFRPENRARRTGTFVSGAFFRADPTRSTRGGLCLSLDESVQYLDPETIQLLHEIGTRAIKKALKQHEDHFVGLILGHARQGNNYFDLFTDADEQLQLL